MIEKTFVLVKPDGVRKMLIGEILRRFEKASLKVIGLKMLQVNEEFASKHYLYEDIAQKHGEKIWKDAVNYISEGPVLAIVLEGKDCVAEVRKLCGATNPQKAAEGTIRSDFARNSTNNDRAFRNIVHASGDKKEAKREIDLWFRSDELYNYEIEKYTGYHNTHK